MAFQWFTFLMKTADLDGSSTAGLTDEQLAEVLDSQVYNCPSVIHLPSTAIVKPQLAPYGVVIIGVFDDGDARALVKNGWQNIGRQNIDPANFASFTYENVTYPASTTALAYFV